MIFTLQNHFLHSKKSVFPSKIKARGKILYFWQVYCKPTQSALQGLTPALERITISEIIILFQPLSIAPPMMARTAHAMTNSFKLTANLYSLHVLFEKVMLKGTGPAIYQVPLFLTYATIINSDRMKRATYCCLSPLKNESQ